MAIPASSLMLHPLPDLFNSDGSFFTNLSIHDDQEFDDANYLRQEAYEDIFDRQGSCTPRMGKREASYGSLLSILSENSPQTISSCSFDEETDSSCDQVSAKLDRVDDFLYDLKCPANINDKLKEDCQTWSKTFPHFRLKGFKATIHPQNEDSYVPDLYMQDEASTEEIIAEHFDPQIQHDVHEDAESKEADLELIERIQEKVLAKLVDHLLALTLEWRAATSDEKVKPLRVRTATASVNRSQLRPMTAEESHQSLLPPVVPASLRPLDGILVISSKILQNRRSLNYLSRPGSSVPRVKTADQSASRFLMLKGRLSKLSNNLENIDERHATMETRAVTADGSDSFQSLVCVSSFKDRPDDFRSKERPFSLPPVHATAKEQLKNVKKSPPAQKLAWNRSRSNQNSSRPPSARETSRNPFGEPEVLPYQGTLPALVEENNFLKIRSIPRNAQQNRRRQNAFLPAK